MHEIEQAPLLLLVLLLIAFGVRAPRSSQPMGGAADRNRDFRRALSAGARARCDQDRFFPAGGLDGPAGPGYLCKCH
jgi:hypothetical protein